MNNLKMVTIQAVNPKSIPSPVFIAPAFDQSEGVFRIGDKTYKGTAIKNHGGETIAYETNEAPLPLSTTQARPFKHGDQFDMDDPKDKMQIDMLIDQGFLCREGERPNPQQHRFFMKDKMSEAKRAVDRGTSQSLALNAVNNMTEDDRLNIAFIEKQPVRQMSPLEISGYVFSLASSNPQRILDLTADKDFKVRAFVQKLVAFDILKSGAGGIKYGGEVIGLDEDGTVAWMKQNTNKDMVQLFRAELDKKGGSVPNARKAAAAAAGDDETAKN